MSDDAQDAIDLAAIEVGGQGGTEGAEDATAMSNGTGEAESRLSMFGSVDVSNLPEETVQAIEGLAPEARSAIEAIIEKEARELRRVSNQKMMEAAEIRKQSEAVMSRAQYADMIDQLMKNGGAAPGQTSEAPTTVPLTEIDYDAPDAEDQMAARLAEKLGLESLIQRLEQKFEKSVSDNPQIKRQALLESAAGYWNSLETQGTALTQEQRQIVATIWDKNNPDPMSVNPADLPAQMQPIVDAVLAASRSTPPVAEARNPSVANPLPPSGSSAASARRTPVWEREKRKPTNTEVLRDSSDGVSLEDLEKALARDLGNA